MLGQKNKHHHSNIYIHIYLMSSAQVCRPVLLQTPSFGGVGVEERGDGGGVREV